MKRLVAVAGLAVFLVACSDTTVPSSLRQAHVAARSDGIPPPPPLSGDDGFGDLSVGFSDAVANAQPAVDCSHSFPTFGFSWTDLEANGSDNQVVHVNLTSGATGSLNLHDIQNGKFVTHGTISETDGSFSFTIQGTTGLNIGPDGFNAEVTGTLTMPGGATCQATATLTGTFISEG